MLAAFDFRVLAHVDAVLNGIATALIVSGLIAIKRGAVAVHKRLMLAAAGVSAVFLACYLTYHLSTESVHFTGTGWIRAVYYPLLISHIVLAIVQVPLILRTIWLGLKDRREPEIAGKKRAFLGDLGLRRQAAERQGVGRPLHQGLPLAKG